MFTYDAFVPGRVYGIHLDRLTEDDLRAWGDLYGSAPAYGAPVPAGMLSVLMLRAYGALIAPRPPGNIHAAQSLDISDLPASGEEVATTISCESKEIRKARRFVHLRFASAGENARPLFTALFTSMVAG